MISAVETNVTFKCGISHINSFSFNPHRTVYMGSAITFIISKSMLGAQKRHMIDAVADLRSTTLHIVRNCSDLILIQTED